MVTRPWPVSLNTPVPRQAARGRPARISDYQPIRRNAPWASDADPLVAEAADANPFSSQAFASLGTLCVVAGVLCGGLSLVLQRLAPPIQARPAMAIQMTSGALTLVAAAACW